ncbi:hypothetical protein [Fluviicola sp.]|uniref:hypothetical protein n=1 Tax=Fluviicola sp. TaxID=1917219 RepID=UPI00260FE7C2|nr:hypothetical protein [Fluviicola sp.]
MSDLTKFSDGASILQQVDVSDIFKNLALGIAEAQQKLDDNSIAQAIKLAQTQINGVSLLELGFAPVFYAFQYADISASINLKMALKESLEFGFGLDIELANKKGYSEDSHNFLSKDNYSETSEEYKTSRQVSFRAKEKKAIKINNKLVKQNEELQARSRIEKFKHDIIEKASVEQVYDEIQSRKLTSNQSRGVDVWMDGGYLRIEPALHYITSGIGVLKIQDQAAGGTIDVDGGGSSGPTTSFPLASTFNASLTSALSVSGGQIYGLSKTGNLHFYNGSTWDEISSTIYFGFNSDEITYNTDLKRSQDVNPLTHPFSGGSSFTNKNHNKHQLIHQILRLVQNSNPDAGIVITGMTDPKGGDSPANKSLAKRRAEKVRDHIFGDNGLVNVEIDAVTNGPGGSDLLKRYAGIKLDADYIIFVEGNVTKNATPAKTATSANKFVYADDNSVSEFNVLNVQYGSTSLSVTNSDFDQLFASAKTQATNHSFEITAQEFHYLLDDEAIVKFSMFTNQSEEIAVDSNEESSSEGTESSDSFLSSKTKNEQSILSDSTSKKSQDNTFALGASVDFRMSRQFEMSMEGNASMSARLVSVPAPQGFVVFLQNVFVNTPTE